MSESLHPERATQSTLSLSLLSPFSLSLLPLSLFSLSFSLSLFSRSLLLALARSPSLPPSLSLSPSLARALSLRRYVQVAIPTPFDKTAYNGLEQYVCHTQKNSSNVSIQWLFGVHILEQVVMYGAFFFVENALYIHRKKNALYIQNKSTLNITTAEVAYFFLDRYGTRRKIEWT